MAINDSSLNLDKYDTVVLSDLFPNELGGIRSKGFFKGIIKTQRLSSWCFVASLNIINLGKCIRPGQGYLRATTGIIIT